MGGVWFSSLGLTEDGAQSTPRAALSCAAGGSSRPGEVTPPKSGDSEVLPPKKFENLHTHRKVFMYYCTKNLP